MAPGPKLARARGQLHGTASLTALRPGADKLYKVVIPGCRGHRALTLRLCTELRDKDEYDKYGVCRDGLWRIRTPGLPDRWLRLWGGRQSLLNLLQRYTFMDASGCAYSADPAVLPSLSAALTSAPASSSNRVHAV